MSERLNPMIWHGEEEPDGVFVGGGEELTLLGLPQGVKALSARRDTAAEASAEARACLSAMAEALDAAARGEKPAPISLRALSDADRALVCDVLGSGEVSAMVAQADGLIQVSESVFPGLWLCGADDEGPSWAEVGDVPACAREAAEAVVRQDMPLEHIVPPDGAMNVMGVLAEIRHVAKTWTPRRDNHVLNFTLLPMTPADASFLAAMMGEGPVRFASGGYGSARVIATAFRRVWAVQYLNSMGVVILDTIEIGDVPSAACACLEDFEDSAARLRHILKGALQ